MKIEAKYQFTSNHHDPFGMLLVGRNIAFISENYKFGFNGQEQDDEVYGDGNLNTAEFWEYDTRLGRRWNLDPDLYYWQSAYSTFNNNPIIYSDPFGLSGNRGTDHMSKRAWEFAQKVGGTIDHGDKYQTGVMWVEYVTVTSSIDENGNEILTSIGVTLQKFELTKGEKLSNSVSNWFAGRDCWVHSDEGEEFGRTIADMNPGIAASHIIKGLNTGSDIYNVEMSGWDYVENSLSIIPGEGMAGKEISLILNLGKLSKFTGKIMTAAQVAKRLETTVDNYHNNIKKLMKKDFANEMKELKTTNPDFTPDEFGNVVVVNPQTKETIRTEIPFDSYKD